MAWRVARSLDVLLGQLNDLYPHRSKVSDGSIGDAAHASRNSDHNPWYGPGIVTARDFTHDPDGGINCHWLAQQLVTHHDRRIKYIIWDHKIWQHGWSAYNGPNPHTKHLHLSVVASPLCDNTTKWNLGKVAEVTNEEIEALATRVAQKVWSYKRKNETNDASQLLWNAAHDSREAAENTRR